MCEPSPIEVALASVTPAVSCSVVDNGDSYTIDWTYEVGAPAVDALVFRSRDAGSFGWRARTSNATFTDSNVSANSTYAYQVILLDENNVRSEPTDCF